MRCIQCFLLLVICSSLESADVDIALKRFPIYFVTPPPPPDLIGILQCSPYFSHAVRPFLFSPFLLPSFFHSRLKTWLALQIPLTTIDCSTTFEDVVIFPEFVVLIFFILFLFLSLIFYFGQNTSKAA